MAPGGMKDRGLGGRRREIDRIDAALLRLLNRRAAIVARLHAGKVRRGEPVYNPARTLAILDRVVRLNRGPLTDAQALAIFAFLLHHFALGHRPSAKLPPPPPPLFLVEPAKGADVGALRRLCRRHGLRLHKGRVPRDLADARDPRTAVPDVLQGLLSGRRGAVLRLSGEEDDEALAALFYRANLLCLALRPWRGEPGGGR